MKNQSNRKKRPKTTKAMHAKDPKRRRSDTERRASAQARRKKQSRKKRRRRSVLKRYMPARLRQKTLSRKELLILFIPAAAAVLAVVVGMFTLNQSASYKLGGAAYQYYGGSSNRIESGELKRTSEGTSLLVQGGQSAEATLPIYASDSRKVVLPTDMLYFAPRSGGCDRLVYFSEVECKENGTVVVRREGRTVNPEQGFLYDGKDFYLFLEPVVVSFNGYTMELPAMSYVEAVYGGQIMVFNYETKEVFMEMSDGTGTVQTPSGDYVLSLLGDSMTLHDGTKLLLATRPDLFDPLV